MSEDPNIQISEVNDDEIINEELNVQYEAEDLIKQNEELLKKLALAENTLERKKGFKKNGEPRKKAEMTPARKQAIEKMKEGRKKWLEQKRKEKEMVKVPPKKTGEKKVHIDPPELEEDITTEEEVEVKPKRKPRKKKKTKKIIVEPETESSSEEEVIIVKAPRRRRKRVVPPKRKVIYEDETTSDEDEVVNPDPQPFTSYEQPQKDNGYGGIKFR